MKATASSPCPRVLTAGEVRALKSSPVVPGQKQRFLQAMVGSMSQEEVADLEQRINRAAERVENEGSPTF